VSSCSSIVLLTRDVLRSGRSFPLSSLLFDQSPSSFRQLGASKSSPLDFSSPILSFSTPVLYLSHLSFILDLLSFPSLILFLFFHGIRRLESCFFDAPPPPEGSRLFFRLSLPRNPPAYLFFSNPPPGPSFYLVFPHLSLSRLWLSFIHWCRATRPYLPLVA